MSKIVGVTVGTPISVRKIDEELKPVKSVNGKTPDENGNVDTDGSRGTGILKVKSSTLSASGTGENGAAIKYKMSLSTVTSEAGVAEVLVGDVVLRSYYTYQVVAVDATYVYLGEYSSIRGAQGSPGDDYVLTDADKEEIAEMAAELVDAPEGGGGDTWRLVADVRLTEDTATIEITQDTAGNAFALKEYLLIGFVVGAAENTNAGSLYVRALNKADRINPIAYAAQTVPVSGGKKTISFYGKVCGKRLRVIFGKSGDGSSETNAQMYTMIDNSDASFPIREWDSIRNISLSTNVAGYGTGTRLELWGVDA